MAWRPHGRAQVDPSNPVSFAICDGCGFLFNINQLTWQHEWAGPVLQNLRYLVCPTCLDVPQTQLKTILIPPDPLPTLNARPQDYIAADIDYLATDDEDELITDDGDNLVGQNVANNREDAD